MCFIWLQAASPSSRNLLEEWDSNTRQDLASTRPLSSSAWGAWLAQSAEHAILELRGVNLEHPCWV